MELGSENSTGYGPMTLRKVMKLSETNYHIWRKHIEHVLLAKGLLAIALEGVPEGTELTFNHTMLIEKARGLVLLTIPQRLFYLTEDASNLKELFRNLEAHFLSSTMANKRIIKRQWNTYQMEPNDSISNHISKLKELAESMAATLQPIEDSEMKAALLETLSDNYEGIRTALEISGRDLSLADIIIHLRDFERTRASTAKLTNGTQGALYAGNHSKRSSARQQNKPNRTSSGTCAYCQNPGHFWKDCTGLRRANETGKYREGWRNRTPPSRADRT